jgi:NhaP-type Na+/H+ or K+/H+ antiporter
MDQNAAILAGNDTIVVVAGLTVLLSVLAHGISANPLVKAIAGRSSEQPPATSCA